MNEAGHTVSFAEAIGNGLADFFDHAGVVTSDNGTWRRQVIDVQGISGVESDILRLDDDEVVAQAGPGNILHQLGLTGALDLNCSSGGHTD